MRKIRKISFFGILGILTAVLFLASISYMQAQVQTKGKPDNPPGKPDKPDEEEATWAVQLPDIESGMMLYGDGNPYVNDGNKVIVKTETMKSKVKGKIYYTYFFCFKLVYPTDRYAGFKDVGLYDAHTNSELSYCLFPGGCGENAPECMKCFLNQEHPVDGSEYFYLKFWISEFSLPGRTLEDMPIDISYPLNTGHNGVKFRIQNTEDFFDPETQFHNIDCEEHHTQSGYGFSASITKTAYNTWKISFDNEDLLVQETYTIRKHPVRPITENVVPLEATGNFTFWIDFIKVEEEQ